MIVKNYFIPKSHFNKKEKERMLQHPNVEVEVEKETVRKATLLPLTEEQFAFAGHTQSIIDERGSLEVVDIRRNEYT